MRNQRRFRPFLLAVAIIATACWCLPGGYSDNSPPPSPPENTPTYTLPPPAPPNPFTPTPEERCWIFEQIPMQIKMHDMLPSDKFMTMYIVMPGGVPGLELQIVDDQRAFEYWVEVGEEKSDYCEFMGYAERLYCFVPIRPEYHNSVQPFNLLVNLCGHPLLSHPALSVMVDTTFDDIPVDTCGPSPGDSCGAEYEDWCNCKGGVYECIYYGGDEIIYQPVCILP
ncbi:MAG: hypothetical protein ABFS17_11080 [Chloroflexota bacterium]